MTTTQPFADVFALFDELVTEIERLLPKEPDAQRPGRDDLPGADAGGCLQGR